MPKSINHLLGCNNQLITGVRALFFQTTDDSDYSDGIRALFLKRQIILMASAHFFKQQMILIALMASARFFQTTDYSDYSDGIRALFSNNIHN